MLRRVMRILILLREIGGERERGIGMGSKHLVGQGSGCGEYQSAYW